MERYLVWFKHMYVQTVVCSSAKWNFTDFLLERSPFDLSIDLLGESSVDLFGNTSIIELWTISDAKFEEPLGIMSFSCTCSSLSKRSVRSAAEVTQMARREPRRLRRRGSSSVGTSSTVLDTFPCFFLLTTFAFSCVNISPLTPWHCSATILWVVSSKV